MPIALAICMHHSTIRALIRHTCQACGAPELADGIIEITFNDKFTSTIADAEYFGKLYGLIRISSKYWKMLSYDQKVELIIHEVCHLIHDYKYCGCDDASHGKTWKTLMRAAGIEEPQATLIVK